MIAGGSGDSAEQAGPSTGAGVDASGVSTDEAYARELDIKLVKKGNIKLKTCACSWCRSWIKTLICLCGCAEIDADTVVEDPLGVAACVNQPTTRADSASGSPTVVVDDLRTLQPIRMVEHFDVGSDWRWFKEEASTN